MTMQIALTLGEYTFKMEVKSGIKTKQYSLAKITNSIAFSIQVLHNILTYHIFLVFLIHHSFHLLLLV